RPRQRHHQQKEPHADRRALLPSGGDAARLDQLSTISRPELLNYFLSLRAEDIHTPIGIRISTKRNVKPVALLTFDDKVTTRKILGVWFIFSSLRDHIDKQVPSPSLSHRRECAGDGFLLFVGCPASGG